MADFPLKVNSELWEQKYYVQRCAFFFFLTIKWKIIITLLLGATPGRAQGLLSAFG